MGLVCPNTGLPMSLSVTVNLQSRFCSPAAGATLLVLREALLRCMLTDDALRRAVHVADGTSEEKLAEQSVLDAVVSLLDAGAFRC